MRQDPFDVLKARIEQEYGYAVARRDDARSNLDGRFDAERKWHPPVELSPQDKADMENLWKRETRVASALFDLLELAKRLERNRPWPR